MHGGEEKIEQVRVGLLSFQRDVEAIRYKVEARHKEMEQLLSEKKHLKDHANIARALLDFAERVEELEKRLMIDDARTRHPSESVEEIDTDSDLFGSEVDESEDEEQSGGSETTPLVSLKRLQNHIQKYVFLTRLSARIGDDHPFFRNQQPRLSKIRATVLVDLKTALEQANHAGEKRDTKTLAVLRLYKLMGEDTSAVTALKNLKI